MNLVLYNNNIHQKKADQLSHSNDKFLICQIKVYLNVSYFHVENYLLNVMKYVAVLISYPLYNQNFFFKGKL